MFQKPTNAKHEFFPGFFQVFHGGAHHIKGGRGGAPPEHTRTLQIIQETIPNHFQKNIIFANLKHMETHLNKTRERRAAKTHEEPSNYVENHEYGINELENGVFVIWNLRNMRRDGIFVICDHFRNMKWNSRNMESSRNMKWKFRNTVSLNLETLKL